MTKCIDHIKNVNGYILPIKKKIFRLPIEVKSRTNAIQDMYLK
jgi:hypothetical protein